MMPHWREGVTAATRAAGRHEVPPGRMRGYLEQIVFTSIERSPSAGSRRW
jgi:hypothetical protein